MAGVFAKKTRSMKTRGQNGVNRMLLYIEVERDVETSLFLKFVHKNNLTKKHKIIHEQKG